MVEHTKVGVRWHPRPLTHDHHVIEEVIDRNCYRLPDTLEAVAVVDIGAHIGTFAAACFHRGCSHLTAFEADPRNYGMAVMHLVDAEKPPNSLNIMNMAVVGDHDDRSVVYVDRTLSKIGDDLYASGGQNVYAPVGHPNLPVRTVTAGKALSYAIKSGLDIWLKIDAEGSEHDILRSALPWRKITRIMAEVHDIQVPQFPDRKLGTGSDRANIIDILENKGYVVEVVLYPNDPLLSLVFATREGDNG